MTAPATIRYPDPPWITPLRASRRLYRLVKPYAYAWYDEVLDCALRLEIPAGVEYDGASVPRLLWTLSGLTPDGLIRAAALVHDMFYKFEGCFPVGWLSYKRRPTDDWKPWALAVGFSRAYGDYRFWLIALESGERPRRARAAYLGVRIGGRRWRQKRCSDSTATAKRK